MDGIPPFFPYAVNITGTLVGWDVAGPRIAAVICGIAAALFCALWLMRAMGPIWGLVGGVLAATSFWQLMFSRQAVPSISSALFIALGLWLSWLALEQGSKRQPNRFYRRTDLPLYVVAGAVFGFGFHSHVSYAVVPPLVLLTAGVIALNQQRARRASDALGPGLLLLAMVIAMTPLASHYLDHPDDFRRALDLAAGLPEDLADTGDDVAAGLRGLFWRGSDNAAVNLPGRSIFGPILSFWTVAGLAAAHCVDRLGRSKRPSSSGQRSASSQSPCWAATTHRSISRSRRSSSPYRSSGCAPPGNSRNNGKRQSGTGAGASHRSQRSRQRRLVNLRLLLAVERFPRELFRHARRCPRCDGSLLRLP